MGIRLLQTFARESVPNGFVEVSIIDECEKYQRDHNGEKPTIVVDSMGLRPILNRNKTDILYGGRHGEYFQQIDRLFHRLSQIARLVFFFDGSVVDDKLDTWLKRQDERYEEYLEIFDKVNQGIPIETIANSRRIPAISHLDIVENRAKAYGTCITAVTKDCDTEIAQYACTNPSVIAVLSEDSDFLIFRGTWRFFSIEHLNEDTLKTMEYSKTALRNYLGLDDKQLMVFATISGNDVLRYNQVHYCHRRNFPKEARSKFPAIADLIRRQVDLTNFPQMCWNLADFLLNDTSAKSIELVKNSLAQYSTDFVPIDNLDPLLNFCIHNSHSSVLAILQGKPTKFSLTFYDLRRTDLPDFFAICKNQALREIGIVLQHKRHLGEKGVVIYAKRSIHNMYQAFFCKPIYPTEEVPSLLELLDRPNYPQHDNLRFKLLKWLISENLGDVDLAVIPKPYFVNVLTLYYMVDRGFITVREADLILLSIQHVVLDTIPEPFERPSVVHERAFQISLLFSGRFASIIRAVKVVGLRDLVTFRNFDGVFFHKYYLETDFDPTPLLSDINDFRIYSTLQ